MLLRFFIWNVAVLLWYAWAAFFIFAVLGVIELQIEFLIFGRKIFIYYISKYCFDLIFSLSSFLKSPRQLFRSFLLYSIFTYCLFLDIRLLSLCLDVHIFFWLISCLLFLSPRVSKLILKYWLNLCFYIFSLVECLRDHYTMQIDIT